MVRENVMVAVHRHVGWKLGVNIEQAMRLDQTIFVLKFLTEHNPLGQCTIIELHNFMDTYTDSDVDLIVRSIAKVGTIERIG